MSGTPGRAGLRGLRGRIAAVTGAGGEIGRAICVRLADEGVAVIATDRTAELAAGTAAAIAATGGNARSLAVDLVVPKQVERIVPFAIDQLGGPPDILVCCAGIQTFADILELALADWERVFDVNARGTFLSMRAVAPAMRDAGRGAIVTVASVQGRLGSRYYAHYAASKAAVLSLTKSFAVALAPSGVRVNAVAPGIVDTEMWRTADRELARIRGVAPGEPRRERVQQVPLGRAGTPDDVAGAVAFLASDDASYITGETIHVCGGDVMV
jgi:NAD(P)-dependent dehydrogenase (short-subunit alcohol dehydrogenase family)